MTINDFALTYFSLAGLLLVGLLFTLLFWTSFGPFARRDDRERHDPI